MKIEAGKRYVMENGPITGELKRTSHPIYCFFDPLYSIVYTRCGNASSVHPLNLIREYCDKCQDKQLIPFGCGWIDCDCKIYSSEEIMTKELKPKFSIEEYDKVIMVTEKGDYRTSLALSIDYDDVDHGVIKKKVKKILKILNENWE